jgi:hypothetical protein
MSHITRVSFDHWMRDETYIGQGCEKGTKKEAILYFFYEGLSPWIKSIGYKWLRDQDIIAAKFLRFCYEAEYALTKRRTISLLIPKTNHRDYPEDRDTFDYFVTTDDFNELIDRWSNTIPIIGSRLQHFLIEFCYVWIDVESGRPGAWTLKNLEGDGDSEEEDGQNGNLPDMYSKRRKNDLY